MKRPPNDQPAQPRQWRPQAHPFVEAWPQIAAMLAREPDPRLFAVRRIAFSSVLGYGRNVFTSATIGFATAHGGASMTVTFCQPKSLTSTEQTPATNSPVKQRRRKTACAKPPAPKCDPIEFADLDSALPHLFSPFRPPAWPWKRASYLLDRGLDPVGRIDNERIRRCFDFGRKLAASKSPSAHASLAEAETPMSMAYELFTGANTNRRSVVEAWVLTGSAAELIAAKTGLAVETVNAYEAYFFDVRDRLEALGYILHEIIRPRPQNDWTMAEVLKHYGYFGGPYVLERIIDVCLTPGRLRKFTSARAALEMNSDDAEVLLAVASLVRPITPKNAGKVIKDYLRMRKAKARNKPYPLENLRAAYATLKGVLDLEPKTGNKDQNSSFAA
ncbi:MAG TPA: hypothetical protein VE988_17965 [Gemmataceae bacterium]|nr:hypothetical protein [Gemmataceae bacterium]